MTELSSMVPDFVRFGREDEFQLEVSSLLSATRSAPVTCHHIGESEEGRAIVGYVIGSGAARVSLIGGSHSDEPVGPESLRALVRAFVRSPERFERVLENFTFVIVPHVNPDGEVRNAAWMREWPSIDSYLRHQFRELPGRDVEFGYPSMRPENEAVSGFLRAWGPYQVHASLHGMGFSDGALLLIDRHWIDRTEELRERFAELAVKNGLRLHDHDRGGEKGFEYIGPGFSTTPRGAAMRNHFTGLGDPATAEEFHDSSMEFVRSLGGDPLCLVTELPLFLATEVPADEPPGIPETYLRLKEALARARQSIADGKPAEPAIAGFGLSPIPIPKAMRIQIEVIEAGMAISK